MNDQQVFNFNTPVEGNKAKTSAEKLIELCEDLLKYRIDIEASLVYADNSHTFDDVSNMVVSGRLHLYPLANSFVIMERQQYPQHAVYHCFLAGGDKYEIEAAEPMILANAKALKCKHMTIVGRGGWVRELRHNGWKHKYSVLSKEVV